MQYIAVKSFYVFACTISFSTTGSLPASNTNFGNIFKILIVEFLQTSQIALTVFCIHCLIYECAYTRNPLTLTHTYTNSRRVRFLFLISFFLYLYLISLYMWKRSPKNICFFDRWEQPSTKLSTNYSYLIAFFHSESFAPLISQSVLHLCVCILSLFVCVFVYSHPFERCLSFFHASSNIASKRLQTDKQKAFWFNSKSRPSFCKLDVLINVIATMCMFYARLTCLITTLQKFVQYESKKNAHLQTNKQTNRHTHTHDTLRNNMYWYIWSPLKSFVH